jgi:hypothetical protein
LFRQTSAAQRTVDSQIGGSGERHLGFGS